MSFPKRGYEASKEWTHYFNRKNDQRRANPSKLLQTYHDYTEHCKNAGESPLRFLRWLALGQPTK
jgi:hypothetical protein